MLEDVDEDEDVADDNSEEQKELTQSTEYPDRTRTEPIHAWLPI